MERAVAPRQWGGAWRSPRLPALRRRGPCGPSAQAGVRPARSVCARTESTIREQLLAVDQPRLDEQPDEAVDHEAASLIREACSVSALCANRFPPSTWRSSSFSGSGTDVTLQPPAGSVHRVNDIVVFGATGFVGRLVASTSPRATRTWRSRGPLRPKPEALDSSDRPLIVADVGDPGALTAAHGVVHDVVGPYRARGPQARRRVHRGGHRVLRPHGRGAVRPRGRARHDAAVASGARIVPYRAGSTRSRPTSARSRSTTRSARWGRRRSPLHCARRRERRHARVDEGPGRRDAHGQGRARKIVFDPTRSAAPTTATCGRSPVNATGGWVGPFVMATYNTRIVRRSHELLDYGPTSPTARCALFQPGRRGRHHGRAGGPWRAGSR